MSSLTLFLLPGLMCDADVWKHQQTHLADLARIVIPNFRGFDSLPAMAETVLQTAPDQFAVAGHSMGGRVALELWNLAPARVCKLALLETGADPLAAGEASKRQALIDLALNSGMQAVADTWLPSLLHPNNRHMPRNAPAQRSAAGRASLRDSWTWPNALRMPSLRRKPTQRHPGRQASRLPPPVFRAAPDSAALRPPRKTHQYPHAQSFLNRKARKVRKENKMIKTFALFAFFAVNISAGCR